MALAREKVIQAAERLVARGKVEAAIREYRKVLADNPRDTNTLNRVGDLYARIEHIDDAVGLFTRIAEHYTEDGFFVKAIAIYKKIIKLDPTRLEIYERLAELYHRQGLVNEARTQYQVLVDYYQKHGQAAAAIGICRRMLALEPNNPSHRARLADLLEQEGEIGQAIEEYRSIAGQMIATSQSDGAVRVYEKALEIQPDNVELLREGVEKLRAAGATAAAAKLLATAARHNPAAEQLLRQASQPESRQAVAPPPQPAFEAPPAPVQPIPAASEEEVAEVLGWDQDGGASAPATAPSAPRREPEPEPELEGLDLDLSVNESFVLDFDSDEPPASMVQPPADLAPPSSVAEENLEPLEFGEDSFVLPVLSDLEAGGSEPSDREDSGPGEISLHGEDSFDLFLDTDELERTASELVPQRSQKTDDLVAEAEVLSKYGLRSKALERLDEVFRTNPQHLGAYALQITLYLEEGRHERVTILANEMAAIASETGQLQLWQGVRDKLIEAGYRPEGPRKLAPPLPTAVQPSEASPTGGAGEWLELDVPDFELPPLAERLEASAPVEPEPTPASGSLPAWSRSEFVELEELPAGLPEISLDEPESEGEFELEPLPELAAEPEPAPPPAAPAAPVVQPAAPAATEKADAEALDSSRSTRRRKADLDLDRTLAELSGLAKGAGTPRRRPAEPAPPAQTALPAEPPRPAAAAPSPTPAPDPPAAAEALPAFSEADLDGLEIFDLDQPVAPVAPPEGPGWLSDLDQGSAAPAPGGKLFDDEQEFFDLAAELEEELKQEELGGENLFAQPHEQSLEEIVEGFKRGVAEHLSTEDYETHFNLGIAYREMGLLDEAIGEFQLASKSPARLVDCCSMLGISFLEKGLPELAVKWYRRGLDHPGLSEDESLALLYDLGNAYAVAGDREGAYKTFVEVYGTNSHYRDVVARLEELAP